MIDPLKITVVTPGIGVKSVKHEDIGISGSVVAEFLMEERTIRVKDDLYSLPFPLTSDDIRVKLDTLLNAFLGLEQYCNEDASLEKILLKLTKTYGDRYKGYTLK